MKKKQIEAMKWYYGIARQRGEPALAAWFSAKRTIHFRETLRRDVQDHKRRSRAAKKAWKVRKAVAA